ncbi:ATP-binding protein [Streptomyces sp. NPDC007325]|uniref:ATP-binding protein n=1 Tax=Streptomyces sp. NPDC007325 TaxID=3154588 RepID=UPI0033C8F898
MEAAVRRHLDIEGPDAAMRARQEVLRLLREAGLRAGAPDGDGAPVDRTAESDAVLVVTELVVNAVRHAGGVRALDLVLDRSGLGIAVTDRAPDPPAPRTPSLTGEGGLGLAIVARLSGARMTCRPAPGGKSVHVHLPLSSPEGGRVPEG